MGVWIETKAGQPITATELESHPVWVCGLKLAGYAGCSRQCRSHPVWVCGLKQ